nr:DNA/RNA nuclease SfsA [uncultured Methanobrevibacter sp.]
MKYEFDVPLIEGKVLKRNSQFTLDVEINGNVEKVHCPTTGRIGDIDLKNIAGLLSTSDNPKRKTKYTLEAISVSNPDRKNKKWVGINQIASNKYIEFFLKKHLMDNMLPEYDEIRREVRLGKSKLDFLAGDTYLEVKTPLQTLQIEYDTNIKTKKVTSFSSTDRFIKHINELADSLESNEKAILLNTFQYDNPGYEILNPSTNYYEVSANVDKCIEKGLEIWQVNMNIDPEGMELIRYWNTTENFRKII